MSRCQAVVPTGRPGVGDVCSDDAVGYFEVRDPTVTWHVTAALCWAHSQDGGPPRTTEEVARDE